ncbi:AGE family epimerase/isomerase [Kushneria phosphatilytica]|uniref:AGE family epimerase/isomerase n=1 Tax=Kushneria phosphatilytica TaxID=657387 RepID=A0A1S1NYX9_9GAMM|nr:AGE family epimerase/isomerase [Kushneria phosphatilytica]OHV10595.1 sugar isomerase [Kushneria phosphatilytica]QEL11824.1 AGE family epimerase/isomerase [Kushneria phosphatilytica]
MAACHPFIATTEESWLNRPAHRRWLIDQGESLIAFGKASRRPEGGFATLDEWGHPIPAQRPQTLIAARMTHTFALAALQGIPGAGALVDHGISALTSLFHDDRHGGWFAEMPDDEDASGIDTTKQAYLHAFVALAAASATAAGRPGARVLLDRAVEVIERHFWSDEEGRMRESFSRDWQQGEAYRGANSNMHSVEAFLALADVLEAPVWRQRALSIAGYLIHEHAVQAGYLVVEHFDEQWQEWRDYNRDQPGDQFRPYGLTPGHALEWSRLLVNLEAGLLRHGEQAPDWLLHDAIGLFDAAVTTGWAADGAPGFVYTVDWQQQPVVRARMHWVIGEGVAAAAALLARTGQVRFEHCYRQWWDYIDLYLIDRERGSWHHELDEHNQPSASVWSGKPDIYHAYQATLFPRLPLAPTAATLLAERPELAG